MRRLMLAAVLFLSAGVVRAQEVELRYSAVYDGLKRGSYGERRYPTEAQVRERVTHFKALWETRGPWVIGRIRTATRTPFPREPIIIYLLGCGRVISDPLTISLYTPHKNDCREVKEDGDILWDVAHELLHHVAASSDYEILRSRLDTEFPNNPPAIANHILVAAFETRIFGLTAVQEHYKNTDEEYRIALLLARSYGLTAEFPLP